MVQVIPPRILSVVAWYQSFSPADLNALNKAASQYEHHVLVSPTATAASETLNKFLASKSREELQDYTANLSLILLRQLMIALSFSINCLSRSRYKRSI